MASGTNQSLTPRLGIDTNLLSGKPGLSTSIKDPASGKYKILDVKKLNENGLDVIQDDINHASVRPKDDKDLKKLNEWADSSETANEKPCTFTQAVKKSVKNP